MKQVLFLDTFAPFTNRHKRFLDSFLRKENATDVLFGILVSKDDGLSPKDKEAILKLGYKSGKTIFLEKEKLEEWKESEFFEDSLLFGDRTLLEELGLGKKATLLVDGLLEAEELFRKGQELDADFEILDYVADHPLFFAEKIALMLQSDRYRHSVSVARTAYEIAKSNGLAAHKAFQAGLFHDIAKDLDKSLQKRLVKEYMPQYADYPGFSMHQFAGRILAERSFGIKDEEVLSAISCHCTGKANMTLFEQTLYCADKCEPLRDFETRHIYEKALQDVHQGFLMTLVEQVQYLTYRKVDYHTNPLSSEMYDSYLKEVHAQ